MNLKTFLYFTSAMSLAVSLAGVAASARADDDGDHRGRDSDRHGRRSPRVVVISLDGAKPDFIQKFIDDGVLPRDGGLARLSRRGAVAVQNVTASPSLTAVSHIEIATGSTSVHNDIPSNTFQAIVGPISSSISGFAAPIGGYQVSPLGPSPRPTAVPLWVQLRQQGKKVVTATWPGSDGANISINNTVVQPAQPTRVTDYTVPFGAFGGIGAQGFSLSQGDFAADPAVAAALQAAGHFSFSPVLATSAPIETFSCSSAPTATCTNAATQDLEYAIRVAALDTTNDRKVNYDTLVFFDTTRGITAGPFPSPSTGPAYARFGGENAPFFFEGSGAKVGIRVTLPIVSMSYSRTRHRDPRKSNDVSNVTRQRVAFPVVCV